MSQKPQAILSNVYHGAGVEVSKVVALESGPSVSGAHLDGGQASVVLVLHAELDGQPYTMRFGWEPAVARDLGKLLIEQADRIDRDG